MPFYAVGQRVMFSKCLPDLATYVTLRVTYATLLVTCVALAAFHRYDKLFPKYMAFESTHLILQTLSLLWIIFVSTA